MTINWENYHRFSSFQLIDAAFLWLEIEPTPEMAESPPYLVSRMKETLNLKLNQLMRDDLKKQLEKLLIEGDSEEDAIEKIIKRQPLYGLTFGEFLLLSKKERKAKKEVILENPVPQKDITDFRLILRGLHISNFNSASRLELIKIAELMNERPKFLFPEEYEMTQGEEAQPNKKNNRYDAREKEKDEILIRTLFFGLSESDKCLYQAQINQVEGLDRDAHLALIRKLLNGLKIDPFASEATSKIERLNKDYVKATRSGETISIPMIRKKIKAAGEKTKGK